MSREAALISRLDRLGGEGRASVAQNKYIGIEHFTEEELDELRTHCEARAKKRKGIKQAADAAQGIANQKAARAD